MQSHGFSFRYTRQNMTVDLELTNKCNLHCQFCPREKTPQTGFMSTEHFTRIIQRIQEYSLPLSLTACGLGDPLLHPLLPTFIKQSAESDISFNLNTSGTLLTPENSIALLDAGLHEIRFSVTGIHETYTNYYGYSFEKTIKNISEFQNLTIKNQHQCQIKITIVMTKQTFDNIDNIINFWHQRGIPKKDLIFLEEHNRAGSYQGLDQQSFLYPSHATENDNNIIASQKTCPIPFFSVFIGWDGKYYLCALDWEKKASMGNVEQHSIQDVVMRKSLYLTKKQRICNQCSYDPENYLYDILKNPHAPPRQQLEIFQLNNIKNDRLTALINQASTSAAEKTPASPTDIIACC